MRYSCETRVQTQTWDFNILLHSQEVFVYPCICSWICDTAVNRSRTGCGLETDSRAVTDCCCQRVCVHAVLFSLTVCGEIKLHPNKDCSLPSERGKKGEWAALLHPSSTPLFSPPPPASWMPGSWMAQRRGREERRRWTGGWHSHVLCVAPSVYVLRARWWRSAGFCFGFHRWPLIPGFQQMGRQQGPDTVCFRAQKGF